MLAFCFSFLSAGSLFTDDVSLVEVTSSTGISFVPLVLGTSKLSGLFSGSGTYLPFVFQDVRSDKPTVSSALSIGAYQKNSSQPSALSSFTMAVSSAV